jgi:hypothetical protein
LEVSARRGPTTARPVRRNIAHLTPAERQAYIDAVQQADLHTFPGGVSYWDKQDEIHQSTHNHGGNSFLPWHRELVNRYEALLQQSNPDVALHYWDWTQDPRAASDGQGNAISTCVRCCCAWSRTKKCDGYWRSTRSIPAA